MSTAWHVLMRKKSSEATELFEPWNVDMETGQRVVVGYKYAKRGPGVCEFYDCGISGAGLSRSFRQIFVSTFYALVA